MAVAYKQKWQKWHNRVLIEGQFKIDGVTPLVGAAKTKPQAAVALLKGYDMQMAFCCLFVCGTMCIPYSHSEVAMVFMQALHREDMFQWVIILLHSGEPQLY